MDKKIVEAITILKQYSDIKLKVINSEEEKQILQSALKLIVSVSDDQNFGICASTNIEAFAALKSYLKALGYNDQEITTDFSLENKSVYLKFSTQKKSYNLSDYQGDYRGVLITIFSDFNDEIMGTYGHFPLDLFS
ncbi:hypothetical protein GM3708_1366 [Geminocystis sp. NIES-3708]|uniref:DUF1824 family protein n=1 Tax=Geminocystis sp. NIES-3708 TaxID=1615909 RepID=UPI0005FCB058|nr:DUF1824 family protein [Geminocystis sp. NIES-3708]BAQ60960.1 hypothetical protein GM3708_1366 [Geminocystis sp. NIES-3708]